MEINRASVRRGYKMRQKNKRLAGDPKKREERFKKIKAYAGDEQNWERD